MLIFSILNQCGFFLVYPSTLLLGCFLPYNKLFSSFSLYVWKYLKICTSQKEVSLREKCRSKEGRLSFRPCFSRAKDKNWQDLISAAILLEAKAIHKTNLIRSDECTRPYVLSLRVSQGGGVLVPLFPSKIAQCSHVPTLSQNVFVLQFFEFCSPVPKNWLMFPCSLRYFANVPLFPKTPGKPSSLGRNE